MKEHLNHVLQYDKATSILIRVYHRILHLDCNIPFNEIVRHWIYMIEEFFDRWLTKSRNEEITYKECSGFTSILKRLKEVYILLTGEDIYEESELCVTGKLKEFEKNLFFLKDEILPLTQLPDDETVVR